jgi:hypothetical protein
VLRQTDGVRFESVVAVAGTGVSIVGGATETDALFKIVSCI